MNQSAFDEFKWRGLIYDHTKAPPICCQPEDHRLQRFRRDRRQPAYRSPGAAGACALATLRHHPIAVAGGGRPWSAIQAAGPLRNPYDPREDRGQPGFDQEAAGAFPDFDSKTNPAQLVNNADWLLKLNLIDFLRDIGKHFTINTMITKESVRTRLEREEGISFTEFSYMLMQSYDFLHLYQTINCLMQTGGSDQWGNITAGVELIRRVTGQSVQAMVP